MCRALIASYIAACAESVRARPHELADVVLAPGHQLDRRRGNQVSNDPVDTAARDRIVSFDAPHCSSTPS